MVEAVRADKSKTSGAGNFISRVCKFIRSCLFNLEIDILLYRLEKERNDKLKNRCSKGWHKFSRETLEINRSPKKCIKFEYLRCKYCCTRFFSTAREKKRFEYLNSSKRWQIKKAEKWR